MLRHVGTQWGVDPSSLRAGDPAVLAEPPAILTGEVRLWAVLRQELPSLVIFPSPFGRLEVNLAAVVAGELCIISQPIQSAILDDRGGQLRARNWGGRLGAAS
eukprot:2900737-Pyramimonas_sp.AAC.1